MFCTVEEAKSFKKTSEELIKLVKENLPEECKTSNIECFNFEIGDRSYALCEVEEDQVISEGKYEHGGTTYQLIEFDKSIASYPCTKSITNEYDLLVYVGFSKTGSYYTDWYYEYNEPELQQIILKTAPEIVIPEHEIVTVDYL